ncbi:MAG: hypothetical protein ACO1RT_00790 [Planctomycetaceae bacterium]
MVRISDPAEMTPPVDQLAVGPPGYVDTDAITQSAVDGLEGPLTQEATIQPGAPPLQEPEGPPAPPTAANADTEAEQYARELGGVWQSEATQRSKQMALIALLSLFGLIAAAVVFSQFVRTWRQQEVAARVPAEVDAALDAAVTDPQPPPAAAPDTPTADRETPPLIAEDPKAPAIPPQTPTNAEAATGAQVADPPQVSPVDTPPEASPPADLQATTSINTAEVNQPLMAPPEEKGDESAVPPLNNLPPGLMKFTPLLSLSTSDNQTAQIVQPPPTIDTVRIEDAAVEEEADNEANSRREPVDVDKSFAQRFVLQHDGASLTELTLVISQLTTVPIEIELIALDAAGIRIEEAIKTAAGGMSAREWMDRTCASLGLVWHANDGRVMISASDERIDAGISSALQLDDFGDEAATVYQWLTPLLAEEPPAPAGEGEEAEAPMLTTLSEDGRSIIPAPSLRARMRAALAIEAVRLMRGMPGRLDRWRTSRWMGPWPRENAALDGSTFGDWPLVSGGTGGTPLDSPRAAAGFVRTIASLNQKNVLVGWYDATRQGLYPADPVMPYSRELTAAGMLDEMLGEYGLQTRVCGPALWYVCSEARYDRFEVITWYEIQPGSGEQIVQRIAKSLDVADPATLPVAFDDRHLIVRSPRFLARQIPRFIDP